MKTQKTEAFLWDILLSFLSNYLPCPLEQPDLTHLSLQCFRVNSKIEDIFSCKKTSYLLLLVKFLFPHHGHTSIIESSLTHLLVMISLFVSPLPLSPMTNVSILSWRCTSLSIHIKGHIELQLQQECRSFLLSERGWCGSKLWRGDK